VTESELLVASHSFASRMDVTLEFWISGTFAVLVTFFFVGSQVTKRLKWLSVSLYFIFSTVMIYRYFQLGAIYTNIRIDLEQLGSNYMISVGGNSIAASLTMFLLVSGTLTTVFFIFGKDKILRSDSASDS
jgi:predicted transcriptional regulator